MSDKAKIEILEITSNIDSMIIKKFPNYKETIKSGGNKVYNIVSEQSKNLQNTIKIKSVMNDIIILQIILIGVKIKLLISRITYLAILKLV